jgi:prepilin signal peptidase PulO-like enzyme (type II secretory pathway)
LAALAYVFVIQISGLRRHSGRLRIPFGLFLACGLWVALILNSV